MVHVTLSSDAMDFATPVYSTAPSGPYSTSPVHRDSRIWVPYSSVVLPGTSGLTGSPIAMLTGSGAFACSAAAPEQALNRTTPASAAPAARRERVLGVIVVPSPRRRSEGADLVRRGCGGSRTHRHSYERSASRWPD